MDSRERIATDTSRSASRPTLVCLDCDPDAEGTPVYDGDEWGSGTGNFGQCQTCGRVPEGLDVVHG